MGSHFINYTHQQLADHVGVRSDGAFVSAIRSRRRSPHRIGAGRR